MRLVYIAGPFRGPTPWDVEQNVRNAEGIALAVWNLDMVAVCPHLLGRHFDKQIPDSTIMGGMLDLLLRCDVILMTRGWENSSGSIAELDTAKLNKIPAMYSLGELKAWRDFPVPPAR